MGFCPLIKIKIKPSITKQTSEKFKIGDIASNLGFRNGFVVY